MENYGELKEIVGFENYLISKDGKIFNKRNLNKCLCSWKDNVGYMQVVLRKNNKKCYKRVHRLVAKAFIPNPNNLPMVNHKDGNKTNNNVDNLEWCTNSQNTQDAYDKGYYKSTYKVPVKAIHKETGEVHIFRSIRKLAEELKLNRKTVSNILNGQKTTNNYDYYFEYIEIETLKNEN